MLIPFPVIAQWLGVAALLVGVFLLMPLASALLTSGAIVLVLGTALEYTQKPRNAPSDRRRGTNSKGAV